MPIKKLPVKKLVEFRRLSKARQLSFTNRLKTPKESTTGGGDYWVRSISAISNAFVENDNSLIKDKLEETMGLYDLTQKSQTKTMYKRNIDILNMYKNFDFEVWRPTSDLKFLKKPNPLLEMNSLPIQIRPNQIFSYGTKNIGGIWFITWLEGFKQDDLGIYSEALYRYLSSYYSDEYTINPAACITVDVSSTQSISYKKVLDGEIPSLLDSTIIELKKYLE